MEGATAHPVPLANRASVGVFLWRGRSLTFP
jgi:hypothetical protein